MQDFRSSGSGMARALSTAAPQLFAANFTRSRSEAQAAVAVDATGMCSGHAQQSMFNRGSGTLRLLHRLLD